MLATPEASTRWRFTAAKRFTVYAKGSALAAVTSIMPPIVPAPNPTRYAIPHSASGMVATTSSATAAEPARDHHAEDDDRATHGDDGQGVADAPEHADERGGADPSLPGDDGGDGDHVVGIGRVPHAEEEAEENDRHRGGHAHSPPQVPAPRSPVCESALATIRSPATEMTS